MTKKIESKSEQRRKAVQKPKETELDKIVKNMGEQISEAVKKNIKVLKTVKCSKQHLEAFAQVKDASEKLQELQSMFDKLRSNVWTKIEKELNIKSYCKKGAGQISIKYNEEKKVLQIVEDKNPRNMVLGGVIKI